MCVRTWTVHGRCWLFSLRFCHNIQEADDVVIRKFILDPHDIATFGACSWVSRYLDGVARYIRMATGDIIYYR